MAIKPGFEKLSFRRFAAEALAIAAGVFIALLVDNWNEDRKDRQIAWEFLEGIELDLHQNNERINRVKGTATGLKAALERVIQAVETGENLWDSPDDFVLDLVRCTYLGTPSLSSIAFDELQSTGSMRLIEDVEFKRRLANYYAVFRFHSQYHAEYRRKEAGVEEALLGFLPLADRLAISDHSMTRDSAIDVEQTLAQMRDVPKLVARLEDMVWVQHRIITRYDSVVELGNELLANIDAMRTDDR